MGEDDHGISQDERNEKKHLEGYTVIAKMTRSHLRLLRAKCAWALVRVGNVSQALSRTTVPVAQTLHALMHVFKSAFFDAATASFVDASRCADAESFAFKAELVGAIAAVRDYQGRSPLDACLFLLKVLKEDSEWAFPATATAAATARAGAGARASAAAAAAARGGGGAGKSGDAALRNEAR